MYNPHTNDDNTIWRQHICLAHTIVAFICWPLYWTMPWIFGVLISPYLVYLIFRPRQEYLLPLLLHTFYGSQQRYMMLAACFLYCLVHHSQLRRLRVQVVFNVYMLFLPFFVWYTCARISVFDNFVSGGVYEGISYYLSLSAFFWAVISFRRLDKRFFLWLMIASLMIVVRGFLFQDSFDNGSLIGRTILSYTRFHSWGAVYMPVVFIWAVITRQDVKIIALSGIAALLVFLGFLHIGHSLIQFHLAGAALLGGVLIVSSKFLHRYPKLFHPWIFLVAATVIVFWAINRYENRQLAFDRVKYDEIYVRSLDDLVLRAENKLYGDRAPVWTAAMNAVRQQLKKSWFLVDPNPVMGELYRDDGLRVEIELQAHNLFLEALRLYGAFGGGGILLSFILVVGLRRFRYCVADYQSPYAPVAATAIGHIVFGYWAGQYLIIPAFSFIIYSLIGVCYRNQFENEAQKLLMGRC